MRTPRRALRARRQRERRERRSRWRLMLLLGGGVLVAYYAVVLANLRDDDASAVSLDDGGVGHPADRVTLEVEAVDLDTGAGALDLRIRPVPHGRFAQSGGAELRETLALRVSSPGEPPLNFDLPAGQPLDPVAAAATTTSEADAFPFDEPRAELALQVLSGDELVPVDVEIVDDTEGWSLSAVAATTDGGLDLDLDANRELLPISFAVLYVGGIVVVALITVAVTGGVIARGRIDFERVIWLGAMLVAIPAVRNEMPGVPPVGTLVDLFVFLPSVVIVALALLAAIVVLAITEAQGASKPDDSAAVPDDSGSNGSGSGADGVESDVDLPADDECDDGEIAADDESVVVGSSDDDDQ